jgi:hypothetical protein
VSSDHDQPPASGESPAARLRPRTLDLTADEIAPEPVRTTAADAPEGPPPEGADHAAAHPEAASATSADPDTATDPDTAGAAPSGDLPPEPPSEVPPRRRGWLPAGVSMLGAGVAGAGIVLAVLGTMGLLTSRDNGLSDLDARLAGIELEVRDLAARTPVAGVDGRVLDEVTGRLDTLEAAVVTSRPAAGDPSLSNRIAAMNGEVKALAETIATLGRRGDEALAAAHAAQTRADAAAAAVAALAQKIPSAVVERSEVDALAGRVAAMEKSEKSAASGDRAVRLVLVATALKSAAERGEPFAGELAAAKALGADPKLTAALEPFAAAGVPTVAMLARELSALAASLRPAQSGPPRESFLERLQGNAEKLVRMRPTEEVAGTDAAAVASRLEGKAAQEDLAGAQAELAKLPPAARAPAEAWAAKVQARTAALDASRRLAADALAGLGK